MKSWLDNTNLESGEILELHKITLTAELNAAVGATA